MELNSVYWIHLKEHTDFTSQGYIGVTSKEPVERLKQHVALAKTGKIILSKAIRKHGAEVILTALLKGSEEYCYEMENKLRPSDRIGWNTVSGGGKPPVFSKGHSDEAKAKISAASKRTKNSPANLAYRASRIGHKHSEETLAKLRDKEKGRLPWETSRSDKTLWVKAADIFSAWCENGKPGNKRLEKILGLPRDCLNVMHEKFKKLGWEPEEDNNWLDWVSNKQHKEPMT